MTQEERDQAIEEISSAIVAMNDAWIEADFDTSSIRMPDGGWITFNGSRRTMAEAAERRKARVTDSYAGQYISNYDVRYDVLSRDVIVTTWENDFARILHDGTQTPIEVALMTLVWHRTKNGWIIRHYHESTRPKVSDEE